MSEPIIKKLNPDEFYQCSNIWNMENNKDLANKFYQELLNGNRITFVYQKNNCFIAEGSLVLNMHDDDYTIKGQRIYFSRLIVKKNTGIRESELRFLII